MKGSLYHWGILGMKWGVRRFQNKDGSLTAEGRRRYGVSRKEVDRDYQKAKDQNQDTYNRLLIDGKKIVKQADQLSDEYQKAYTQVKISEEQAKKIASHINNEIQAMQKAYPGQFDYELFESIKMDYIDTVVDDMANKLVKDKREEFDNLLHGYWDDVHTITENLFKKYDGVKVYDYTYSVDGRQYVNMLLDSDTDTSYASYIYRHFDDYWVGDTDARYEAIDRITAEIEPMINFKKQRDWRSEIMS